MSKILHKQLVRQLRSVDKILSRLSRNNLDSFYLENKLRKSVKKAKTTAGTIAIPAISFRKNGSTDSKE